MSNVSNTDTDASVIDVLANIVEKRFTQTFSLLEQSVVHSAAERSADRKKVNEVDEKADLANCKADKNAEDLKAVNSKVHAHQQDIIVLHRNDATREVELRLLKLVMMAVVAYLWWIGHAWSGHARMMHYYNDASIHIMCVGWGTREVRNSLVSIYVLKVKK